MKLFIFSCLLAVALAKHIIKQHPPSNEEPANIFQEKFKQGNVFFQPSQDASSSLSSEESAEEDNVAKNVHTEECAVSQKQLEKLKQLYQDFYYPQPCQSVHQQRANINPWAKIKTSHDSAIVKNDDDDSEESTNISQEEILKKIAEMVKVSHQLAFPPVFPVVHPQQLAVNPWNAYPVVPFVRNV